MNFKVYIGDEIYLAYIWTNDQAKYTPVVLKSAKIPTLENKQIGLANILREKKADGTLNIVILLVDIQTGVVLEGSEIWIKPEQEEQEVKRVDTEVIDRYIHMLIDNALEFQLTTEEVYQALVDDFYKSLPEKRPDTILKLDPDDPMTEKAIKQWAGWTE